MHLNDWSDPDAVLGYIGGKATKIYDEMVTEEKTLRGRMRMTFSEELKETLKNYKNDFTTIEYLEFMEKVSELSTYGNDHDDFADICAPYVATSIEKIRLVSRVSLPLSRDVTILAMAMPVYQMERHKLGLLAVGDRYWRHGHEPFCLICRHSKGTFFLKNEESEGRFLSRCGLDEGLSANGMGLNCEYGFDNPDTAERIHKVTKGLYDFKGISDDMQTSVLVDFRHMILGHDIDNLTPEQKAQDELDKNFAKSMVLAINSANAGCTPASLETHIEDIKEIISKVLKFFAMEFVKNDWEKRDALMALEVVQDVMDGLLDEEELLDRIREADGLFEFLTVENDKIEETMSNLDSLAADKLAKENIDGLEMDIMEFLRQRKEEDGGNKD